MSKKRRIDASTGKPQRGGNKKKHLPPPSKPKSKPAPPTASKPQKTQAPKPPFGPTDTVLLVGEGDFSFALSLRQHLHVRRIVATSLDSADDLARKYHQAAEHLAALLAPPAPKEEDEDAWDSDDGKGKDKGGKEEYIVHHGIDATALMKRRVFSKSKRRYTKIVFMFPHVGGVTKDQGRQVVHNQTLLLGFFKSALPLLAPGGVVVVTLFDGMPYELWDVRRLAREAGLVGRTSLAFDAKEYEGYRHARTLGNVEGGGGWKGEERKARMFLFESKEKPEEPWSVATRKRKVEVDSDED